MRYGARLTHRWKGWLFSVLATAGLLAVSPGTAAAQITATLGDELAEGATANIAVTVNISVGEGANGGAITLTATETTGTAEDDDVVLGAPVLVFNYAAGPADDSDPDTSLATTASFSGVIPVQAVQGDTDAEDETTSITVALTSNTGGATAQVDVAENDGDGDGTLDALVAPEALDLTIKDDETQTYTLAVNQGVSPTEGTAAALTLRAVPAHEDDGISLTLHLSDPVNYEWDNDADFATVDPPTTIRLGAAEGADDAGAAASTQAVWINPPGNDRNRTADTVTLTAYSGSAGNSMQQATVDVSFADIHVLPSGDAVTAIVVDMDGDEVMNPTITEGGDAVTLKLTVDRGMGNTATTAEALTVEVMPANAAQAADFRLSGDEVAFAMQTPAGKQDGSRTLTLSAVTDEDVGAEDLVLNLVLTGVSGNGSGSSTGTFSIPIMDATEKQIAPKSQDDAYPAIEGAIDAGAGEDGLNPGETVEISTGDLFTVKSGYTAAYGVSVEGEAVSATASGETVTINAVVAGEAMVTVTGTAQAAGSAFQANQSISNIAEVTFPVTVVNETLVVMVAADPAEIDEGGTSTITATASRMVLEADGSVTINLDVVGDATLDAESITIAAGSDSGSAMLTAAADDDTNDETVTVIASGSGIDGNMQVEIAVNDTTETPAPTNVITPNAQDDAYPVITGAIEEGAGDEGLNPGESFELAASDLFDLAIGYTAAYAVTVEGTAVSAAASGDTVSVTAEMAGEATVTITGTARAASSSFEASQTSTHTAEVMFPVTVVDKALMLTWYVGQGGDDYNVENLVEGQEYEIIVSANRAITEAEGSVEVTFMRDRAASDADDSDYTVGTATLRAGRDHAHARPPLMVLADDISEGGTDDGGNVGEQLVLFGVASNGAPVMADPEHFSTDNGALTIWDTAVPALPVIATWLLGLGLLGGGARQMYLRRRQD